MKRRECLTCGKEFECYHDGKYCCYECYWASLRRQMVVSCAYCGREFNTTRAEASRRKQQYCSKDCYRRGYRGEVCGSYKGGPTRRTCAVCGAEFERYGNAETIKYCSQGCRDVGLYKGGVGASIARRQARADARLSMSISRGIRHSIRSNKGGRHWEEVVGYTTEDLMAHLESQFAKGMTWDNYGKFGWHIDHVRPISDFNFDSVDDPEFKQCWSLWNLQPMWAKENHSKHNRCQSPPLPLMN